MTSPGSTRTKNARNYSTRTPEATAEAFVRLTMGATVAEALPGVGAEVEAAVPATAGATIAASSFRLAATASTTGRELY